MGRNPLMSGGVEALAQGLPEDSRLQAMHLSGIGLRETEGGKALARLVRQTPLLQTLVLNDDFRLGGIKALVRHMKSPMVLKEVELLTQAGTGPAVGRALAALVRKTPN